MDAPPEPPEPEGVDLEVRPSLLGEDAGNGLFVKQAVLPGQVLCEYHGRLLSTAEAMRLENKSYLMRIGPQEYIDAREDESVLARFINDCRNPAASRRWTKMFRIFQGVQRAV
ncbi:unnamed protein product [Durusdinium trenchii]|uniref:SET domain-containing protein n=1 Tax=Durusdinium trenchii TaxID=1381693 RepID=A0ABP0S9E3_9DINO